MMQDIKRVCENPTEEDRAWLPDIAGCRRLGGGAEGWLGRTTAMRASSASS